MHTPRSSVAAIITSTAAVFLLVASALAQGIGPAGPSPATGTASVVANTRVTFPDGQAIWLVSRLQAQPNAKVSPTNGAFLIAENTPFSIREPGDTSGDRIALGEVAPLAAGHSYITETYGAPDSIIGIEPVADNATTLGGEGIGKSKPFDVSAGTYDADLLRGVLPTNDTMTVPEGAIPSAVYVFAGEVRVSVGDADTTALKAGQGVFMPGEVSITAVADHSVVYVAYVGAKLPNATAQAPTPVPATPTAAASPTAKISVTPKTDPNADQDRDGLSNGEEAKLKTNPKVADTDDDGINDYDEVKVWGSDPLNADSDGDILYDGGELVYETAILNPDTDGDGLQDGDEVYNIGTDPTKADSDGDGVNDGQEVKNGSNPLKAPTPTESPTQPAPTATSSAGGGSSDPDNDGLTSEQESRYGTDPSRSDSDGDGVIDSVEIESGTNPLDPKSYP